MQVHLRNEGYPCQGRLNWQLKCYTLAPRVYECSADCMPSYVGAEKNFQWQLPKTDINTNS